MGPGRFIAPNRWSSVKKLRPDPFAIILLLAVALGGHELPREVVRHPRPGDALAARMEWARTESRARGYKTGFWAAYNISRMMEEDSHIGSFHFGSRETELTLGEIVAGKKLDGPVAAARSVQVTAREVLEDMEGRKKPAMKVRRDVALLFRFKDAGGAKPDRVGISDMDLSFDLEGRPLVWLGEASDDESLALVRRFYDAGGNEEFKKDIVVAAGIHDTPALAIPFLESVLKSRDTDEVRKDAAFWIGQLGGPTALKILRVAARTDPSAGVRKVGVECFLKASSTTFLSASWMTWGCWKRTSCFMGCTLTSTRDGSRSTKITV